MQQGKAVTLCSHSGKVYEISIQVVLRRGLPQIHIVGSPGKNIRESIPKLKVLMEHLGCKLPLSQITINLSPQEIPKNGNHYDLPILLALLDAIGYLEKPTFFQNAISLGEVDLEGNVLPLSNLGEFYPFQPRKNQYFLLPRGNDKEGRIWKENSIYPIERITHMNSLPDTQLLSFPSTQAQENLPRKPIPRDSLLLFSYQITTWQALEIALGGRHHILITGVPGSGKTMLAELAEFLQSPPLEGEEFEIWKYHPHLKNSPYSTERPFRAPHHSATQASLLGGGSSIECGEIAKSHKGILFLDELGEISGKIIQSLREPLEKKSYQLTRMNQSVSMDADFQLIGISNLCPCGYYSSYENECSCKKEQIRQYIHKLSGPILDRIPIVVEINPRHKNPQGDILVSLQESRDKIHQIIQNQAVRNAVHSSGKVVYNSEIQEGMWSILEWETEDVEEWEKLCSKFPMGIRQRNHTLSVARTIADFHGETKVLISHIYQAINLRSAAKNILNICL